MEHIIKDKQTLIDIALMYYGNIDAVFTILANNPELNLDSPIEPGTILNVELNTTNDFANYFNKNNIEIATGGNLLTQNEPMIIPSLILETIRYRAFGASPQNIPDRLRAVWQTDDLRFLAYNPEVWMFRFSKNRRRTSTANVYKKKFAHTPHLDGVKFPHSNYYAGLAQSRTASQFTTEFSCSMVSGQKFEIPVNFYEYFYYKNQKLGYTHFTKDTVITDLMVKRAVGTQNISIPFRLAIVIDNPDKNDPNPKRVGPMSNVIDMALKRTDINEYKFIFDIKNK